MNFQNCNPAQRSPALAEGAQVTAGRNDVLGAGQAAAFSDNNTIPKAYINYMFFDRNRQYKRGGFKQVSSAALNAFETLTLNFKPEEEGYMMIYVANQTNEDLDVHFDDLTVEHLEGPIIRTDDYYPFGLTFNSSERSGFTTNKFLFQGQEHQEETGWDSFKWRNHQPDIGRFFNIDPLAEDYYYNSPYAFSENDVISAIELEGLEKIRITNYSKIQSNKIKQNFDTRNKIQNTPPSKEEGKGLISKYVKIDSHNEEISRISRYAADNGFKDDFMVNQLEENGIEVPDAVKVGERTSEVEVEESVVLSFEFYGVQENDDGKLEIAKFGEISDTKENINKTIDGLTIVGVSAADALLGWVISKITGIELPPVSVPEDESKDKL